MRLIIAFFVIWFGCIESTDATHESTLGLTKAENFLHANNYLKIKEAEKVRETFAQATLPGFPPGMFNSRGALNPSSGGGGFQGPGDIVSGWTIYYGFECYNAAYAGNVADIVDDATGNTTGTRLQCSAGGTISALVSGSACTFVTGNACSPIATTCAVACKVVTLYNQAGTTPCSGSTACDVTQATNSSRPVYSNSCVNSKPCMTSVASNLLSANPLTLAQPFTFSGVAARTGNFTNFNIMLTSTGQGDGWYFGNANNTISLLAGSIVSYTDATNCPNSTVISIHGIMNGASSLVVCGGTASGTLNAGASAWGGQTVSLASDGVATNPCTCTISIAGLLPVALNSIQYNALHSHYQSYWGVP